MGGGGYQFTVTAANIESFARRGLCLPEGADPIHI